MVSLADKTTFISSLPNELLLHIFELIPSGYDQQCRDFSALAQVCQSFHALITPLLYRSFENCCWKHMQSFGHTVLARQDRAALVKHFKGLQAHGVDAPKRAGCVEDWYRLHRPGDALVTAVRGQVSEANNPQHYIMDWEFIAGALACICPNLESLDCPDTSNFLLARIPALLNGKVLSQANSFQHVHTLSVSIETLPSFEMRSISLLFNMASIRALTIRKGSLNLAMEEVLGHMSVSEYWLCEPRTSAVKELAFEECHLPIDWITTAVMSCRKLEHFHYGCHWFNDKNVYPRLFHVLAHYKDSLQNIRINELQGCKKYSRDQLEPDQPLSFKDYGALTHVEIPLFLLAPKSRSRKIQDIFPPTVRVLNFDVRSAREGFSDAFFITLAEAASDHLPSLKYVKVICRIEQFIRGAYIPLHFGCLRRMFSRYGVDFIYSLEYVACEFKAGRTPTSTAHNYWKG